MPAWLLLMLQKSLTAADERPIAAPRPPRVFHSPEAVAEMKNMNNRIIVKLNFMLFYFSSNV
jgi:hypothetical protein